MEKELLNVPNPSGPNKEGSKSPGRDLTTKTSRRQSIDAKTSGERDSLKSSGKVKVKFVNYFWNYLLIY